MRSYWGLNYSYVTNYSNNHSDVVSKSEEGTQIRTGRDMVLQQLYIRKQEWHPHIPTGKWERNTKKADRRGLPWWRSGWESACQCRGHGFEPWSGRIPHATEQLDPWATITEPARLEPVLHNKRGRDGERPAHRDEEWSPLATTRESPRTETKTQYSHK